MPCHLASISAADSNTRGTYFDSTSCHTGIIFIKHKDLLPKIRQHRLKSFVRFEVLIVVMLTIQSKSSVIWCCVNTWVFHSVLKDHSAFTFRFNPLNPELNPICYLLALLAYHFLHVSRIRVKSLTLRLLMSCIYGAPILDVSRSHTTTQHSR